MKKTYFAPEVETIVLNYSAMLCMSGLDDGSGSGDGGVTPTPEDPSQPGWGDDF